MIIGNSEIGALQNINIFQYSGVDEGQRTTLQPWV